MFFVQRNYLSEAAGYIARNYRLLSTEICKFSTGRQSWLCYVQWAAILTSSKLYVGIQKSDHNFIRLPIKSLSMQADEHNQCALCGRHLFIGAISGNLGFYLETEKYKYLYKCTHNIRLIHHHHCFSISITTCVKLSPYFHIVGLKCLGKVGNFFGLSVRHCITVLYYGCNFWVAQDWPKCWHWFQWQSAASLSMLCHCANPLSLESFNLQWQEKTTHKILISTPW